MRTDDQHEALLQEITTRRRAFRPVVFPGAPDASMCVRILSEQDAHMARLEAARYCRQHKVDIELDPELFDRARLVELVFRAFFTADERPFFSSPSRVRDLDSVTVEALLELYTDAVDAAAPIRAVSDEDLERVIEHHVAADAEGFVPLVGIDHPSLRRLLRAACVEIRRLRSTHGAT